MPKITREVEKDFCQPKARRLLKAIDKGQIPMAFLGELVQYDEEIDTDHLYKVLQAIAANPKRIYQLVSKEIFFEPEELLYIRQPLTEMFQRYYRAIAYNFQDEPAQWTLEKILVNFCDKAVIAGYIKPMGANEEMSLERREPRWW